MSDTIRKHRKGSNLKFLAHLGAFATVSAWGCSFISTKVLMVDASLTPVEVYVYRFTLAYFLLLAITFRRILADTWKDELRFLVCGLCAGSLYFVTENYALKNTTTANVSLLASTSPIFTAVLVAIVYKARLTTPVIIGSLVAFAGVGCIIFSSGEGLELHPTGDILALCASLSWAIYTIVIKALMPLYNSFFITRKLFFYGVLTALPLLLLQRQPLHLGILFNLGEPQYIVNFLFLVLMCSVGAYIIWNEAMKILGPVTSNNYIYLQPLVTMIAGYFVFDERITWLGYTGCALILGGLLISDKMKARSN